MAARASPTPDVQDAHAESLATSREDSSGDAMHASHADQAASGATESKEPEKKLCPAVIVVGMAGSGKTTLVDALSAYLEDEEDEEEEEEEVENNVGAPSSAPPNTPVANSGANGSSDTTLLPGDGCYVLNLDPAVATLPYEPNVDIRDTVDYKRVMSDYSLGPNGAILTSLNLYATRFDQVLGLVERRAETHRAVVLDTPGQIETFTWSASGAIITESLAMTTPTVLLFVVDVPRAASAMTFVSSMLYACSIMYKSRLPMVVALNKADVEPGNAEVIDGWMKDFDEFDKALRGESFVGELARSMALALEEFYNVITAVTVSAATGEGMDRLTKALADAMQEYERDYKPWLLEKKRQAKERENERQKNELDKVHNDVQDVLQQQNRLKDDLNIQRRSASGAMTKEEREEVEEQIAEEERRKKEYEDADPQDKKDFEEFVQQIDKLGVKSGKEGQS